MHRELKTNSLMKVASDDWRESEGRPPTPRSVWVNAVDKGDSERFGVNAVAKGVSERFCVPLSLARGKKTVDTPRLRSGQEGLMALGDCGNRFSGGEKEGLDGDTVQQNLVLSMTCSLRRLDRPCNQASRSRVRHSVRGDNWSRGRLRCSWTRFLSKEIVRRFGV